MKCKLEKFKFVPGVIWRIKKQFNGISDINLCEEGKLLWLAQNDELLSTYPTVKHSDAHTKDFKNNSHLSNSYLKRGRHHYF